MLIKKPADIRYSEVTPKALYFNRRKFLAGIPAAFLGARELLSPSARALAGTKLPNLAKSPFSTSEKENSYNDVTHYNNFYEFGTAKDEPARIRQELQNQPVDPLRGRRSGQTAQVQPGRNHARSRRSKSASTAIAAWKPGRSWCRGRATRSAPCSNRCSPRPRPSSSRSRATTTSARCPQARYAGIQLPYVEGLRLDEAMHPLTMLTVGMYGETLPPQDGAPVRLTVPWKYGFKSAKSLVKIRLVEKQPPNTWNLPAPHEYGFYSNVNPKVDHPRWSQATERRLGEFRRRPTLHVQRIWRTRWPASTPAWT